MDRRYPTRELAFLSGADLRESRRCVATVHHTQISRVSFGANAKGTKLTREAISLERKAWELQKTGFRRMSSEDSDMRFLGVKSLEAIRISYRVFQI